MENKINWDRDDYWNEYYIYDDYFLSFDFDHCQVDEDEWKELVSRWNLNSKIVIGDSRYNPNSEDISIFNDDYSIVISGINYDGIPGYYLILTFNKNIDMETCIKFFREKGSKINEQAIALLSDQSVTCVVLFAIKENNDGSKYPAFLISQNFRDAQFFIEDFMKLLGEHAKFNQVIRKDE